MAGLPNNVDLVRGPYGRRYVAYGRGQSWRVYPVRNSRGRPYSWSAYSGQGYESASTLRELARKVQ